MKNKFLLSFIFTLTACGGVYDSAQADLNEEAEVVARSLAEGSPGAVETVLTDRQLELLAKIDERRRSRRMANESNFSNSSQGEVQQ